MGKLAVECTEFRRFRKNSLLRFAELRLPDLRLLIRGVSINETSGRRWVGMPSKPMVDKEGNQLRDERGKVKYLAFLQFDTREVANAFSDAAIRAVLAHDPSAFEDAPSPAPADADIPF